MPLPPPAPRRLVHRRTVVCRGYERADGLFDIDATIEDMKAVPQVLADPVIPAGEPVHGMAVRLTIDEALTIKETQAVIDHAPFRICAAIAPSFTRLTGQSILKGFSKSVRELFGGVHGCVHLAGLLAPAATTAYQTMTRRWRKMRQSARRPGIIDTCHAWASDSPVVKREFPQFYSGAE
jgi:hypothetical protein